jgi:hypothetical protein
LVLLGERFAAMNSDQLNFVRFLQLKDGSMAKYEGTDGSGEHAKVKIRRVVLRPIASIGLGHIETVSLDDFE